MTGRHGAFDVAVIGGGIAGAAVAEALSTTCSVILLEAEGDFGLHATGRSAAILTETYGSPEVQQLTSLSRRVLEQLPAERAVLSPRPVLWVGKATDPLLPELRQLAAAPGAPRVEWLDAQTAADLAPLDPDRIEVACLEPDACAVDVDLLHRTLLATARRKGATLRRAGGVVGLRRTRGTWEVSMSGDAVAAGVVVNAAGAWADEVSALAGLAPAGLVPKRRTVLVAETDPPATPAWPFVVDLGDEYYFEASGTQVLASPADETPAAPGNARPEDLDVALCVERLQERTRLRVRRITSAWAGLRTFAPDRRPVLGPDPAEESFVWCAGLGGFGIMTAPAVADIVAGHVLGRAPSGLAATLVPRQAGATHPREASA